MCKGRPSNAPNTSPNVDAKKLLPDAGVRSKIMFWVKVQIYECFVSKVDMKSAIASKYPASMTLELWSPDGNGFQTLVGLWQIS